MVPRRCTRAMLATSAFHVVKAPLMLSRSVQTDPSIKKALPFTKHDIGVTNLPSSRRCGVNRSQGGQSLLTEIECMQLSNNSSLARLLPCTVVRVVSPLKVSSVSAYTQRPSRVLEARKSVGNTPKRWKLFRKHLFGISTALHLFIA